MDEWNNYAFLSLICSLMSLASAVLTLSARRTGPPLLWGTISLVLSVWAFGLFLCFSAKDAESALFWARNLNYVMLFLPVLVFHFVASFVNRLPFMIRMLWLYYAMTIVCFLVVLAWPEDFLLNPYRRFNLFWFPLAGPLFYLFLVLFVMIMGHSLHILLISKAGQNRTKILKINYLILTVVVGLIGGGSTVPLQFGIDVPPYGVLGVALLNVFSTYAILRHDLLNLPETLSLILARLLAYIGIFALLVLVLQSGLFFNGTLFSYHQILIFSLLTVTTCELYAALKDRIQLLADKMLIRHKVMSDEALRELMSGLEGQADFKSMLPLLREFFERQKYMHHYAWYMDQKLLEHTLKKESVADFTRSNVLDDDVYQRILFSSSDGLRHDKLPSILRLNALGREYDQVAKQQMVELMSSEQLDASYAWVEEVPDRELIALPIVAYGIFRGLLIVVVSRRDTGYAEQNTLQNLSANLAAMIERIEFFRRQSVQQQTLLLEKMSSLQALAGSIAHEMRTPLTQLGNFVSDVRSALQKKSTDLNPASDLEFQSIQAQTAIKRSLQVIDITLGQVKNAPVNTGEFTLLPIHVVVNKALAEYVFLAGERDWIDCDLRQSFNFKGDETLLIYVIFNLLKNALYYSHCAQVFEISISSRIEDKYNVLVFRDNGPGVPADKLEQIFEDFFSTDQLQGTGLGLAYCRRVLRSFGGDISCQSELGVFTEFKLEFIAS